MDQSQTQGQLTGTVVNTVVEDVVPVEAPQGVLPGQVVVNEGQVVNSPQPVLINQEQTTQVNIEQPVVVNQVQENIIPVSTSKKKKKEKGPTATSFVVYFFQFILLGITSFFKHGTNMFDTNVMIDNGVDTEKISDSKAKQAQKIELRKPQLKAFHYLNNLNDNNDDKSNNDINKSSIDQSKRNSSILHLSVNLEENKNNIT